MKKKICPHLSYLVYHGEGNPCNCDMARYCSECNKEEPTVKLTENRLKTLENYIKGFEEGNEYSKKSLKTLEGKIEFIMENVTPNVLIEELNEVVGADILKDLWDEGHLEKVNIEECIDTGMIVEPSVKECDCGDDFCSCSITELYNDGKIRLTRKESSVKEDLNMKISLGDCKDDWGKTLESSEEDFKPSVKHKCEEDHYGNCYTCGKNMLSVNTELLEEEAKHGYGHACSIYMGINCSYCGRKAIKPSVKETNIGIENHGVDLAWSPLVVKVYQNGVCIHEKEFKTNNIKNIRISSIEEDPNMKISTANNKDDWGKALTAKEEDFEPSVKVYEQCAETLDKEDKKKEILDEWYRMRNLARMKIAGNGFVEGTAMILELKSESWLSDKLDEIIK